MTPSMPATQTPPGGVDFGRITTRFTPVNDGAAAYDAIERIREIPLTRDSAPRTSRREEFTPRARAEQWCRILNAAIAVVALAVLAPVFVLVAVLIKLTSPGPVMYLQTRIGLDRRRSA